MSRQIEHILTLADAWTGHTGLSHWALSMKVAGKGNEFARLRAGRDLGTKSAERIVDKLSAIWPDDLEWPADIPRPRPSERKAS